MRENKDSEPPKAMTWGKATPALIAAVVFDLVRIFFEFFWLFGPALAGAYCTAQWGGVAVVGKLVASGCVAAAGAAGFFSAPALQALGVVMAMAVGFAGWLAIGGWLLMTNARIFKENAMWFAASLAVSEVPFVGSIPAFTITVWKMYSHQIKVEKAALKKWEAAHAAQLQKQRAQQAALAQQQAQIAEQEAANDAAFAQQAETANDDHYEQAYGELLGNAVRLPSEKPKKQLASVPQYTDKAA